MTSLRSCNGYNDDTLTTFPSEEASVFTTTASELIDQVSEEISQERIDGETIFVSSSSSSTPRKGITTESLSKVWKIDLQTAEQTIYITIQSCKHSEDPKLARDYGSNDCILRYKRVNQYFFMDTFFVTAKGGKSPRRNTCYQLFLMERRYVHAIPMRFKSKVLAAMK